LNIKNIGRKIAEIEVKISYRIIELFSAGLYSSPNKAFEELVCNSYDAFASHVGVYVPPDLSISDAYIWVCDDGDSMNSDELKLLWCIGEAKKREETRDRLQIGRFGIGKLATYILANKLSYICKKEGKYLFVTMDYADIGMDTDTLTLDEKELSEKEAKMVIEPLLTISNINMLPFKLFGENVTETWTFSLLTNLKPKVKEIKEGRLKWVLKTALPLNPNFKLYYNGEELLSSKISKNILKSWIIGKEDSTAEKIKNCKVYEKDSTHFIDFPNLKGVYGEIELYEDSLVEGKSTDLGRSHGIFLMVRNRLVNLDDPLLGMEAFSHGAFNRTRIILHADELDSNLVSTREAIKESEPYLQLKDYIKRKFNNEIRKYYFDIEQKNEQESSLSYRMSKTPLTLSRTPLISFSEKFINGDVNNPFLIDITLFSKKDAEKIKKELSENTEILKGDPQWENLPGDYPIAKLDIKTRTLRINLMHPFIANYSDKIRSKQPIEFIAITEVLTEAHLYEIGIEEDDIYAIMHRRDRILRELVFSDRTGAPLIANMVKDALSDSTGLENAVYEAFMTLGFETKKIGGKGKPDGKADAILGYSDTEKCENYSFTYDTKSTGKNKIKANTAALATINKHKKDYYADYAVIVAIGFEGEDDPGSNISKMTKQQKVTTIKAKDLMRLLLLSVPKQIGLKEIKDMLISCHTPKEVEQWIDNIESKEIERGPIKELLETIYELHEDTEPPEIGTVRLKLNEKTGQKYSKPKIREWIQSLKILVPGFIDIEGERISLNTKPANFINAINDATNSIPIDFQQMYIDALCIKKENN